jgi:transposase, IS5 family
MVHAHQFKRANGSLRKLKTYLGRVIRDMGRRIDGDAEFEEIFAQPLSFSRRVLAQDQRQRATSVINVNALQVLIVVYLLPRMNPLILRSYGACHGASSP